MLGLEALAMLPKDTTSSCLLDQTITCNEVTPEQLNLPIEGNKNEFPISSFEQKGNKNVNSKELNTPIEKASEVTNLGLSIEEKVLLYEETGWSDDIINSIKSPEEAQVYKDACLKEVNCNLERTDIDWNAKIPQDRIDRMRSLYGDEVADRWAGKTNMDLIRDGKAPYGPDGERVNLHHIGQKPDSPLAELTDTEHKVNDGILHDKKKVSEIERPVFRKERETYWQQRYNELSKI